MQQHQHQHQPSRLQQQEQHLNSQFMASFPMAMGPVDISLDKRNQPETMSYQRTQYIQQEP